VPRFAAEYPNELSLRTRELAVGLWPERANPAIVRRHRLLPRGPEPAPYGRGPDYDSLMAQPYWACIDPERACLEAIPGLAKTQEFVLDLAPPAAARFARAARLGHLAPDRGVVEPAYVASTEVFGRTLAAGAPGCAPVDRLTARALGWFERHMDGGWTWGKFDYGDLRYIVFTPESRLGRAYRGTERFPRAGYWNNNENDPLQGLLAHFHLTDQRRAWPLALQAARHLLDVDVRHGDDTGLYTHSFGHCYRAMSHRSMDHLWLDGLATYCCVCDDPFARQDLDGLRRMALAEFQQRPFAADNLRNFVLGITMNLMFHAATHAPGHLEGALAVARDLLAYQAPEGYFPGAGPTWAEQHRAGEGFPDEFAGPSTLSELHALEALHRLHEHSGAADVGEGFLRLARWFVRYNLHPARDAVQLFAMPQGERNPRGSGLFRSGDFFLLPGLAYAYRLTGDPEFARIGARLLRHLCATQLGRRPHPLWEGNWFEHAAVVSADATRTVPQDPYAPDAEFNYITPLSPSFALYKVREMLWAIADAGATPELQEAT